jgi:HlyD family secretion protein
MKVAKVLPQVRNGQFQVEMVFDGPEPKAIQRGQTMQLKLTLGDSSRAVLVPNGAFFNDTGGQWIFVVGRGGNSATRRDIKIGRKNADFIEVLDGLKPGEKVITSSYSGLVDKDHLSFDSDQ